MAMLICRECEDRKITMLVGVGLVQKCKSCGNVIASYGIKNLPKTPPCWCPKRTPRT
jgi:hypothetical protein